MGRKLLQGDSGGAIVMVKKELSFGRTKYQYVILAVAVASKLSMNGVFSWLLTHFAI